MEVMHKPLNVPVNRLGAAAAKAYPPWKRALDLGCVVVFLPLIVVVAGAVALLIKLCSRGPVLYRQPRVGFGGRQFDCLKFRTMKVGADESPHKNYLQKLMQDEAQMTKMDEQGDARLIPLGVLIRAAGLDELPQLINVWRGEMSLVGPRPCLPYEYAAYPEWARRRFEAIPGLTGLWQVSGKNRTTFREMVQLDIWYAEHRSLWLDLRIMARTLPALVGQLMETLWAARHPVAERIRKATQYS